MQLLSFESLDLQSYLGARLVYLSLLLEALNQSRQRAQGRPYLRGLLVEVLDLERKVSE